MIATGGSAGKRCAQAVGSPTISGDAIVPETGISATAAVGSVTAAAADVGVTGSAGYGCS